MIELIATFGITVTSVLLFGYWFRYTCMLILSAKTAGNFALDVATANQLGFVSAQMQLGDNEGNLTELRRSLEHDYSVLCRLLEETSNIAREDSRFEQVMLGLHYRVTGVWASMIAPLSPAASRKALQEMATVVSHFADCFGERLAYSAQ